MARDVAITVTVSVLIIAVIGWVWHGTRLMRQLNNEKRATLARFQNRPVDLVVEVGRGVFKPRACEIRDVTEKGVVVDDGKRERFYPFGAVLGLNTPEGSPLADWAHPHRDD